MDEKAEWISRVLGVTIAPAPGAAEDPAALRGELQFRIREMLTEAKLLPDRGAIAPLIALATKATDAVKGDDLKAAHIAVLELETAVGAAKAAARKVGGTARAGFVNYRAARFEWMRARAIAQMRLTTFASMIRSDEELQQDPDYDEVVEMTQEFDDLLPEFSERLEDLLEKLEAATDDAQRTALLKDARATLAEYRGMLRNSEGLSELQSLADEEFGGVSFFHELEDALGKLEKTLGT